MDHDQYEREVADRNAARMEHMSDADIRVQIAAEKDGLSGPMGYGVALGAMGLEREARDTLEVLRTELLRRACASFSVPLLTRLQMIAMAQAAKDGKIIATHSGVIVLCANLCEMGLMTDRTKNNTGAREFRLTPMARDILEASHDEAASLRMATEVFMDRLFAPYGVAAE